MTSSDQRWADDFLDKIIYVSGRPLVAIHPGSPIPLKRWRPARFAAVADWLIEQKSAQILIVGARDEISIVSTVQRHMRSKCISVAGETTVSQLAALLKRCNLFVGNDSGPMHLAAAVGTRTVGLYGPGNPRRFGPAGSNCYTIRRKPDCPPCMNTLCKFGGDGCMKDVGIDDVIQMISTM